MPLAAETALALIAHAVLTASTLGFVVAEPRGNLIARAFEEAALVAAAFVSPATAVGIAVLRPSRTFTARLVPRVVPIKCHFTSSSSNEAGKAPAETNGEN